jgi:3-hydroxy-9,10-secoandrosta-1,3,5(10)-triene-9,17-dione monooxygenase
MSAIDSPTHRVFAERADALRAAVAARAERTERERRVPRETVRALVDSGLLRGLQPKRFGGEEVSPEEFFDVAVDLAAACTSTGWVFAVLGVHSWHLAQFSEQAQRDVWDQDPAALVCSSYAPTGTVRTAEGGYRLSGRWSFSSGSEHCDWVFLGGELPGSRPGASEHATFLLPRADYDLDDTWHVAGLAGSGSQDVVVADAFVPEHRCLPFRRTLELDTPGHAVNPADLYRLPFGAVFAFAVAAPSIGAVAGALANTMDKVSGSSRADDPHVQLRLMSARDDVALARRTVHEVFDELFASLGTADGIDLRQRAHVRFRAARIVASMAQAADQVFRSGGGHGIYLSEPAQRAFRDVNAMSMHVSNSVEKTARIHARAELGLPFHDNLL